MAKLTMKEREYLRIADEMLAKDRKAQAGGGASSLTPAARTALETHVQVYPRQGSVEARQLAGNSLAYAQQSPKSAQEVALGLAAGNATRPSKGNISALDMNQLRQGTLDNETVMKILRDLGALNTTDNARNRETISMVGTDYLKGQATTSKALMAANSAMDSIHMTGKRMAYPGTAAKKEKAAQWRDFYDLYGYEKEVPLEVMLRAEAIANGTGRTVRDFDLMDDETYDREYAALEEWYKGLDHFALTEDPKEIAYESETGKWAEMADMQSAELSRRETIERLTAMAMGNADYSTLSQYTAPEFAPAQPKFVDANSRANVAQQNKFVGQLIDQQYYINNPGTYSQRMRAADLSPVVREYMNAGYEYLTPDEIGVYNALYSTDQAAAAEYLEALGPDLMRRRAQVQYNYNTVIGEDPFAGAAASLATILRSPAAALNTMYGGITGVEDPNASVYDLQRGNTAIRTAQAQLWGDMASFDVLGQPVGTTIYNTLMSLGDMGMAYLTGGALAGGNAAFAQQAMGFIMSSEAAAGTLHEDLQRGFTAEQALLHGITNGAVEYLSEQIPLGELFSNEGKLAWRILKTGLSEGGEEIFSGTVQIGTDALFSYMSGHESEVETVYKEYAKTMSHEDAVRATLSHYAEEVALQGVTGFLSGGAMGTAAHDANDMQVRSYGKSVMAEGDVDALLNIAGDMRSDSQSAEWARRLTEKKNKGEKISTYDVGRLTMAMESDLSAELAKAPNMVMDKAVEERLVELGEDSANAANLAPVIRKLYRGQKINPAARMSVNWSDNASQVVRELTTEVREGDEGRVGRDWKVRAVQLAEETSAPYVDKGIRFEKALRTKPGTTTETQATAPVVSDAVVQQGEEMAAAGKNKFGPNPLTRAVIFDADGSEQTGEVVRFEKDKDGMHAVVSTTTDGKTANVTVDLESITASASAGIGSVIRYVQNASTRGHDMSAAEASTMIRLYEQEGGDAKTFIDGFEKAYLAGYAGIELDSAGISEGVAKIAYDQGKAEAVADEKGRAARATRVRADSKGVVSWLGKVSSGKEVRGTGDPNALSAAMRKMTSSQRTTVQVVQAFADKFKTNVVLFESSEENIGSIENGSYDPNTNTIYIDINSGADSAESIKAGRKHNTLGHAMVRTLGHELTHHLESTSPEAYATYKQAVKTALKEQGQDWAKLVRGKLDTARNAGRKLTYAGAEAEVIADASEYMLQNSKFVKEIDNSTKGRVKKFIKDFMKKLGEVFSTLARAHTESAAIRKEIDGVKQYMGNLQQLWDAAMEESMGMETSAEMSMEAEAVEFSDVNTQFSVREEAPPKKTGEYQSDAMITAAGLQNPDGSRMFSLRSFTDDYDTYRDMLARHNMDEAEIQALFDTIDVVMKAIETDREILDFGWNVGREDRSFNPVKQNSDPLYKVSIDFSTLCRKRLLQQAVQERLESMYDTVLTKAERVAIRNELMKLREEGKQIEVACALCYVESTRLKSPAQIQRFFDDRRAVLVDYFAKKNKEYAKLVNAKADELIVKFGHEPGTKKRELNTFQKNAVTNLKQSMNKDYKPSAEEEAIIATAMSLPGESFKTDKGLWDLKREHEEIFDAYTSFVRNATKSKGIEGDEAWWAGDSESISDSLIESMNAENGLRTQSWSDFQVIHLLDYMAAIIELSTRNAKMQSYTKVPDFVNLMGDTGVMINLSLIPKGFDGTLNYDPIEGMPIEEALALRDSFPETAGTICIGITKKHIEMLLANPDIDYVIPYHSSSLDKKTRQQMGMKVWEDFQAYQNEKNKDYPNTDSKSDKYHKKPLFSEWFDYKTVSSRANELAAEAIAKLKNPTESQKVDAKRRAAEQAMKEAADRYKELCHQRGLQEKFEQFSGEPNYWKLLIDRKMINQKTGEIIEQKAVKPRFDKDRILNILAAEVNRFKEQNADKDAAVKHIVEAWENGEIRKAARSKKVRDQVSAFNDTVTVANIVASAEELGNPDIRYSTRDLPPEVTAREFLAEADSSIAETVEERNALSIYQGLLLKHADASDKVIAAERVLAAADEEDLPEARKALTAARARQKELYNRLLNVERTAHVQTIVKRTNRIISDLSGKNKADLDNMVSTLQTRLESLRLDLQGLKGAAKTQREADIRAVEREMANLQSKAVNALLAANEKYTKRIADLRERNELNVEIGKKARHIKRVVKRLNDRIIHEEDYKNVKEPLKPAVHNLVRAFIDGFGNLVFDQKTADRLRTVYDKIADEKEGSPDFYSDDVANWLTDLAALAEEDEARRVAGGSSLESVEQKLETYNRVAEIADHIYKMVAEADEIFVNGKRESFAAISGEVGGGLVSKKDKPLLVGKAREAVRIFDDLIRTGNMTPQYFFDHLKNSGLSKLFSGLMTGQTQYAQRVREGQETIADAKRRYNFYAWKNMKQGVEFRTEQGHTISLTVPQMMWVYATAKREATNTLMDTHHLDEGGFRYEANNLPKQKGKLTAIPGIDRLHKLSANDVTKITATLTAEQIACADELVSYLSNECAEQGNAASMALFGIKKYNEEYYFPFKTASDQRYQRSDAGSTSTTNDARVKHASFTHSLRKGANTALVMGDFFDVIADHINLMATYSSFVVPIESMNRVLNTKINEEKDGSGNDVTIRSLVGRKHGDPAQKYIADLMKDLNGGPQTDNRGGISGLFRAFKRGAVMGSLSVALQQPTAIVRAFAYVNPKYFAHITMEGNKKTWERMMKYSGTTVIKDMGKFDVGTGRMANDWIANSDMQDYKLWQRAKFLMDTKGWNAVKDNFIETMTALPGVMDRITWSHIWKAIEAEQADLNPNMDRNSDEFLRTVGARFDDVINHTQVYDSILAKSQNMRSKNPLTQMSTAFMSEPTLNINMLYDAVRGDHSKGQRASIITSVVTSNILAAAAAALIAAWNKDDDDRNAVEKYLTTFASRALDNLNPLTMIPYVADLWNLVNGYDIERTDLSVIKDAWNYGSTFMSKAFDPEKENTWRDYENFFGTIANLFGIPAKNVSRDIRRARNFLATDKAPAPGSNLKYALVEELTPFGLYKASNAAYCQRLVAAVVDGDAQESYDLWDYMTNGKKMSQGSLETNIRSELKRLVKTGEITPAQATGILRKYVPYKDDKNNVKYPQDWLNEKE